VARIRATALFCTAMSLTTRAKPAVFTPTKPHICSSSLPPYRVFGFVALERYKPRWISSQHAMRMSSGASRRVAARNATSRKGGGPANDSTRRHATARQHATACDSTRQHATARDSTRQHAAQRNVTRIDAHTGVTLHTLA
jgi:hypothetical protein